MWTLNMIILLNRTLIFHSILRQRLVVNKHQQNIFFGEIEPYAHTMDINIGSTMNMIGRAYVIIQNNQKTFIPLIACFTIMDETLPKPVI